MIDQNFIAQRELLKTALEATDNYLSIEKKAIAANMATNAMLHDFSYHMTMAHEALQKLGVLDQHQEYMDSHVQTMLKLHGHKDPTIADLPYAHVPKADFGEVEESVEILDEAAEKGLAAKAEKSGVSLATLRKVYKRGVAAWRTGHRPGTTPQQWGMARVNSYIMKGKGTYHGADKDLREDDEKDDDFSDDDLDKMANELSWEDIVDFYTEEELDDEDDDEEDEDEDKPRIKKLKEALTTQARLKRRQTFARYKGKRGIARKIKLRRASDMATLQKRAKLAARRAIYKRFLKGRSKAQLSAAEKDRIEKQVASLKTIQGSLAQKMMPRIRSIEQKRLASYRTKN